MTVENVESLSTYFPLTLPIPTPATHPNLISTADLHREEDLLRNPSSFRAWWSAINIAREAWNATQKTERALNLPTHLTTLLGPLATPQSRASLQRLTFLYESALAQFPASFKLWKAYLQMRMGFVLGNLVVKKRAGGRKKFPAMKDALEQEKEDHMEKWEGGLNGIVGWEEWKSLVATFERALMWLPKVRHKTLDVPSHSVANYLRTNNSFPAYGLCTYPFSTIRNVLHFSRTRTHEEPTIAPCAPSLHSRIWVRYLLWAETRGGTTLVSVYHRYLTVDPSITERFTTLLLDDSNPNSKPRPLEAAKLLLGLARKAARGDYVSPEGKSPYQLLGDWLDVVEKFSDEIGFGVDETVESNNRNAQEDATATAILQEVQTAEPVSVQGQLIRSAGPPLKVTDNRPYDEDEDPLSDRKLNIERIIQQDGLAKYKDQAGRLWTGLATYWIRRGEFDRAKEMFEAGIRSVLTIRDFTQIFDAYAEFCESLISAMMNSLEEDADDEDDEEVDTEEVEKELDVLMREFEELMDRRPFLVNDVLLRRNSNDVQEWEKRVALWGQDDEKVADTYTKALETIHPRKATANLHRVYVNFAKFYEEGGTAGQAQSDLDSARKILEKGTKVNFKTVEDLAEVWCEWAEMEIRHENYDEAIRAMQRATAVPTNSKINYHDHALPVQARLFKSLKLWSFYVDLEESIGTVETTKRAYDKILELRIANAQIIINYAAFLEENEYFEDSFRVYERGVELFTFPVSFEIWNIYLSKFVKRYGGSKIERARDLFDQALEKCPPKSCKPLFLMYAQLEEEHGLAKRAMGIYERATQAVADQDKLEMFTIYIAKAAETFGLPATRPIYERALEVLPDRQTAEMCLRFAALERKLGEIDRARAIYAHASQFCDPRVNPNFWSEWNAFEIETGSEDTFREMLRIKRSVQAQFNTEASYLAAQTMAAGGGGGSVDEGRGGDVADPMAAAERQAKGPAFVAAKKTEGPKGSAEDSAMEVSQGNADEIHISDDDDDL